MTTTKIKPVPLTRSLREVAQEIAADWPAATAEGAFDPRLGFRVGEHPAHPYLEAMGMFDGMADRIGHDGARTVVTYFLSNASGWRGDTARRIKAELNGALAEAARTGVRW